MIELSYTYSVFFNDYNIPEYSRDVIKQWNTFMNYTLYKTNMNVCKKHIHELFIKFNEPLNCAQRDILNQKYELSLNC